MRAMEEGDLPAADHVFRVVFGTFPRMPEPERFGGDLEFPRPRFRADPSAASLPSKRARSWVRTSQRAGEVSVFRAALEGCSVHARPSRPREVSSAWLRVSPLRSEAYGRMLHWGFTTFLQGVAMHRPNEPRRHRPDAFVMDDWR